jgi:hypothetical protein
MATKERNKAAMDSDSDTNDSDREEVWKQAFGVQSKREIEVAGDAASSRVLREHRAKEAE